MAPFNFSALLLLYLVKMSNLSNPLGNGTSPFLMGGTPSNQMLVFSIVMLVSRGVISLQ